MRENRKRHSELTPLQRQKANARSYANQYVRRGKLSKEACKDCGAAKVEMHHEDYTKPLKITWLCRFCHMSRHNGDAG